MTKFPNASITAPASACARMERVVEMFNARRYTVVSMMSDGKTENLSGSVVYMVISRTRKDTVRLNIINMERSMFGRGMIIMAMVTIAAMARNASDERVMRA